MWAAPENLGYPINTVNDDIYLSLDASGRTGFYSSAKENGFGQLDLYSIDFIYRESTLIVVRGQIMDIEGSAIKAKITVLDENSREVQGIYSSNEATGKFILVVNPLTQYRMFIEAEGFEDQQDELQLDFPIENELELLLAPTSDLDGVCFI